jgi:hypothetical protein
LTTSQTKARYPKCELSQIESFFIGNLHCIVRFRDRGVEIEFEVRGRPATVGTSIRLPFRSAGKKPAVRPQL